MSTGDPESAGKPSGSQDISNLQENLQRQQAKISALKELVRKSEIGKSTSSAQEKVKNIAQRLSHIKSKARSRQNLDSSLGELKDETILEETLFSTPPPAAQKARSETPGSEKIQLLRRQVEESKMKMAERESSKREIEERVIQLKAKFDSTQQSLERSSELGRSMGDLSVLSPGSTKEKFKSATDLSFTPLNLDKEKIKFLENRIKLLEKQNEKQANVAPASESELVTSLRNQILDLEENLREKECIIEARTQAVSLMSESLSAKTATTVDTLEDTRLEMQKMQEKFVEAESAYRLEVQDLQNELESRNQKIRNLEEVNDILETARFDLTVKNASLESKLQGVQEYSTKLDELNKLNEALQHKISSLEEQLAERTVECNVLNANFSVLQEKLKSSAPKSLFSKTGNEEAELEIKKLKDQLDEANKGMIKLKLKSKQLQKQVDKFKKESDTNRELVRLTEENQELQMKIVELEEEKGSLQLKLVSGGNETERMSDPELQSRIQVLEITCQNQTTAIQLLEEQKLELQTTKQTLEDQMQKVDKDRSVEVASQIDSIQFEEQTEDYLSEISHLKEDVEKLRSENDSLREEIRVLEDEKQEIQKKVNHYIAENIELLDKVEKLSKSSSSAESIEIVERLTQQEKLEMEEFNKKISPQDHEEETPFKEKSDIPEDAIMGQELSDSLVKLREESSELMHRIELFTRERREVLEKMEILNIENQDFIKQINELKSEKSLIEDNLTKSKLEIVSLEEKLDVALREKTDIESQLLKISELKTNLEAEVKTLVEAKQTTLGAHMNVPNSQILDQCSESLAQMQAELESYRKSNDKSTRLNVSKKLAKEAKNVCQQFSDLLEKLRTQEGGEQKAATLGEDLQSKCKQLENTISDLRTQLEDTRGHLEQKDIKITELKTEMDSTLKTMDELQEKHASALSNLERLRKDFDMKRDASEKEIDILKTLVAEQKQQLIEAYTELETERRRNMEKIQEYEESIKQVKTQWDVQGEKVKTNEDYVHQMTEEVKRLENALSSSERLIADRMADLDNKQDTIETLNAQIMDLYRTMEENAVKVAEKEDEISYLQDLLESNKSENEVLAKENEENKKVVEKLLLELHANKSNPKDVQTLSDMEEKNSLLETKVKDLEKSNRELETKNKEHVDKLKKFAANLKRKTAQCAELESKVKAIDLNASSTVSTQHNLDPDHENVVKALQLEIHQYQEEIENIKMSSIPKHEVDELKNERDLLNERYKTLSGDCSNLHAQITQYKSRVEYFERSINEVQSLVSTLHADITQKDEKIRHQENELETLRSELHQHQEKLTTIGEELKNKHMKFEKSKAVIKEKNREIQRLTVAVEELEKKLLVSEPQPSTDNTEELTKLREEYERLAQTYEVERETFQQTINRLETLYGGIQAKFQENTGYIETLETENNAYKEKTVKLENCIAAFEDRRQSLERHSDMLDAQLQQQTDEYEKNEDALIYRLNMLLDHDDVIGRRLIEAQEEKEDLSCKVEQLKGELADVQLKLTKTEKELETIKTKKLDQLRIEKEALQEQLGNVQADIARQQNIYEGRLAQKHAEIDDLENDLSIQLNAINQEKRKLQETLEKSQDEVNELKDENVRLNENANSLEQIRNELEREMTWIRMQNENMIQDQMQDKTEIENLKHQLDVLIQNHEIELNCFREQIKELDSVRMQVGQNQTDDQVFIENENKRLKEELAEKEAAIENYQRENLKLQMGLATSGASSTGESFSGGSQATEVGNSETINALKERVKSLEEEIVSMQTLLGEKDHLHSTTLQEAQTTKDQLVQLQQENSAIKSEIQNRQQPPSTIPAPNSFFSSAPDSGSVFDDLVTAHHVVALGQEAGQPNQKKIEDLERNVSDLEKYATELESKLKNLTSIHENTLLQLQEQMRRHNEAIKQYEERIKELEEKQKQLEVQKDVESLIVSDTPASEPSPSLNLFFGNTPQQSVSEFDRLVQGANNDTPDHPVPVQEEVIVPKKAYLLYPESTEPVAVDAEEGWGWGSEEAVLEERHQEQLLQAQSSESNKILEYRNRIDELELERNRSDEKVIELQVKCGKLMKKLKEYKTRLDQVESENAFRRSTSFDSNELDLAIQEELKSQVKKLEEKIVEMGKQHEKELSEKENLIKRVDVLTSANERMMELKERQDIEVEGLQIRVRQLSQQLKQLEDWGERDESSPRKSDSGTSAGVSNVQQAELEAKWQLAQKELNDLRIDRDELQALLDDEKNNVLLTENKVRELKEKLTTLEPVADPDQNIIPELEAELEKHRSLLAEKEGELHNAIVMNQNFQLQLNDYQATINQLSSESDSIKVQLEKLQAEYTEKVDENAKLSEQMKIWIAKSDALSKEIENLNTKRSEPSLEATQANALLDDKIQDLTSKLQYKEAETLHLKQKIQDLMEEDQTPSLVQEILSKNQEIVQLRMDVQRLGSEKAELENNLSKQITEEMLRTSSKNTNIDDLEQKVRTLEGELTEMKQEKEQMELELQVLNDHVLTSLGNEDKMKGMILELDTKNLEIAELKSLLDLYKQQQLPEPSISEENKPRSDDNLEEKIVEINKTWEQTVEQKCSEIAESWRQYMDQREAEFKEVERTLNLQIEQLRAGIVVPKRKISEVIDTEKSEVIDEGTLQKMQAALEQQELEIVTLKEQLAMRSAEYARLAAKHDPYALSTSSNISFETKTPRKLSTISSGTASGNDQPNVVAKSELDLALYMLHQRDMRCEELTLELVNLLEERDTLQLKLSNSLRQIEENKQKTSYFESGSESDQNLSNTNSPEKSTKKTTVGSESDQPNELSSKLSQLQSMGYAKDKRIQEEREQRQRQMEKIQQDVANMPSEAVSELVGADLSNTMQSPSNVLLDWLWGKNSSSQQS